MTIVMPPAPFLCIGAVNNRIVIVIIVNTVHGIIQYVTNSFPAEKNTL